jgi:hypothetical protein
MSLRHFYSTERQAEILPMSHSARLPLDNEYEAYLLDRKAGNKIANVSLCEATICIVWGGHKKGKRRTQKGWICFIKLPKGEVSKLINTFKSGQNASVLVTSFKQTICHIPQAPTNKANRHNRSETT